MSFDLCCNMYFLFSNRSSFYVCCYSKDEKVVLESLRLLDTIICYNHLPPQSLPIFIATLCHTANSKTYCAQCWKVNKKCLMGLVLCL